jgi:hypothetical protein
VLYQWTQRATCHSTSRRSRLAGPAWLMASVLNRPMVESHRALSSASPTVRIEPAIPAARSSAVKARETYCDPASEMMNQPRVGTGVLVAATDLQGLPQRAGDHAGVLGDGYPPAQDPAGEHLDDERDVDEAGQRPP